MGLGCHENGIGDEGVVSLADSLKEMNNLTDLFLNFNSGFENGVSSLGVIAVGNSIQHMK